MFWIFSDGKQISLFVSKNKSSPMDLFLSCGDGQTSDVQNTLEQYLSHSVWKGMGTTMGIAAVV